MREGRNTRPPFWKIAAAFVLDLLTSFFGFGYAVAWLTGGVAGGVVALRGAPALIVLALVAGYFIGLGEYGGGTLWQRIFGLRP